MKYARMNINKLTLVLLVCCASLMMTITAQNKPTKIGGLPVYNFEQIEPMFNPEASNDTVYVFNFWATYCAPCIKELPYFEGAGEKYKGEKVKIVLVSLDFKSKIESGVVPFLKRKNITLPVVVLSDPDADAWIDKVDPSWDGNLPATLVVKGNRKEFYDKEFTKEELDLLITKFLEL